jgi:hypothetical protein
MLDSFFNHIFTYEWLVFLSLAALLLVSVEWGFRHGLRLYRVKDEPRKAQIGGTQTAILGLLALLLGFTFALAVGRYETRRTLVLQEANAIGTTYLRASLLPETHKTNVENLLRQYVNARLDFYYAGDSKARLAAAEQATATIQADLWNHTIAASKEAPTPITPTFINALNDAIDLDATRMNAFRAHVPGAVWLLLLVVAICGCWASGYGAGATGARGAFTNVSLPVLIAVVITLIADLDHPRGGLIGISQQPMLDLKQSLQPRQP